jgi:hypothetical protein
MILPGTEKEVLTLSPRIQRPLKNESWRHHTTFNISTMALREGQL